MIRTTKVKSPSQIQRQSGYGGGSYLAPWMINTTTEQSPMQIQRQTRLEDVRRPRQLFISCEQHIQQPESNNHLATAVKNDLVPAANEVTTY